MFTADGRPSDVDLEYARHVGGVELFPERNDRTF
jgi:hypothetical protein